MLHDPLRNEPRMPRPRDMSDRRIPKVWADEWWKHTVSKVYHAPRHITRPLPPFDFRPMRMTTHTPPSSHDTTRRTTTYTAARHSISNFCRSASAISSLSMSTVMNSWSEVNIATLFR